MFGGNNCWFRDDFASSDGSTQTINTERFTQRYVQSECSDVIEFLKQKLINVQTPSGVNDQIRISGLGINSTYSTISFTNCQSDTYLYNLEIENTLTDRKTYYLKDFDFVEQQYVVANWNFQSDLVLNKHNVYFLTENTDYTALGKNLIFDVFSVDTTDDSGVNTQEQVTDFNDIKVKSAILNTNTSPTLNQPAYIYFDELSVDGFSSEKPISTEIRNFLYNKLGKTPNVTLGIWAALKGTTDTGDNPLISDFNVEQQTGIVIDPAKITLYGSYDSDSSNTISEQNINTIDTNWSSIEESNLINRWILYFIEFQHSDSLITPGYIDQYWSQLSGVLNSDSAVLNPPAEGTMRINIHAIYQDFENTATDSNEHLHKIHYRLLAPMSLDAIKNDKTILPVPQFDTLSNLIIGAYKKFNRKYY